MATNPYFPNYTSQTEQSLAEQLLIEAIKIHGCNVLFVPREYTEDFIFGESKKSSYSKAYCIETYITSYENYEGEREIISKFGFELRHQLSITMSVKRFTQETGRIRPQEGDLIYFPIQDKIFVVKFVEDETPFYQLGNVPVYQIRTEMFEYDHEDITTDDPSFNETVEYLKYTPNFYNINFVTSSGSGNFTKGMLVGQFSSAIGGVTDGVTGYVYEWNPSSKSLIVSGTTGVSAWTNNRFVRDVPGITISGYRISSVLEFDSPTTTSEPNHQNTIFQENATDLDLIDFSEKNPFGEV